MGKALNSESALDLQEGRNVIAVENKTEQLDGKVKKADDMLKLQTEKTSKLVYTNRTSCNICHKSCVKYSNAKSINKSNFRSLSMCLT